MKRSNVAWIMNGCLLVAILFSIVFTLSAVGRPFPGFLTYPNLVVSPLFLPGWLAPEQGVAYPWTLHSLDSEELRHADDLEKKMSIMTPGEVHMFTFKKGKEQMVKGLQVETFRLMDFIGVCGPMFISAVVLLSAGVLLSLMGKWTPASVSLFILCISLGGWMGTLPEWMVSHRLPFVLLLCCSMSHVCALELVLFFPSPISAVRRYPFLAFLPPIFPGLAVLILFLVFLSSPGRYVAVDTFNAVLIIISTVALGAKLAGVAASSSAEKDRAVARLSVLWGIIPFALAWIPLSVLIFFFHISYGMFSYSTILVGVPPAAMAWAYRKASVP